MLFIIHANGETGKRDSMENNILYLSDPLIKQAPSQTHRRRGQDKLTHISVVVHCAVVVLFRCLTASTTGRKYSCVSTLSHIISFSITTEMTAAHMEASLLLGHSAHSVSIHAVQYLIASCSAFSGSIIPADPCL